MRNKHAITLEHLRMGALKGVILDADGSTLYDLYSEFGISPKTVNFALSTSTTEVLLKVLEVKRHIEDNLRGEFMTGIMCLCSQGFFDALTTHTMLDHDIVRLLNERTRHVLEIGEIKLRAGEEIYAPHRELAVLDRICKLNKGPMTTSRSARFIGRSCPARCRSRNR